ncbi:MAG TPA: hypothetical protein IGS37_04905 [Synechococcales cyanobacterium M55_K2018_004]|nr:hypothetical protein [Synechococcales cyanobacterium M55_K2018_004]
MAHSLRVGVAPQEQSTLQVVQFKGRNDPRVDCLEEIARVYRYDRPDSPKNLDLVLNYLMTTERSIPRLACNSVGRKQ